MPIRTAAVDTHLLNAVVVGMSHYCVKANPHSTNTFARVILSAAVEWKAGWMGERERVGWERMGCMNV